MNPALARVTSLLGLVTLGEGLFILFRVVPHESPLLGAGLAAAGAFLLHLAPPPPLRRVPPLPVALVGALLVLAVAAHTLLTRATLVPPKVALLGFGAGLVALAPLQDRRMPGFAKLRVATLLGWGAAVVGVPLATWGAQAALKTPVGGTTPLELFLQHALLTPLALVLGVLGHAPTLHGQVVTFATPRGPMSLEVGVACSGIQAMGLFAGLLMCHVAALRPTPRRALAWAAIGLGGVYLTNVTRLVALALIGSAWGGDALERAHAEAGWIFFVAWAAAFAALTTRRPKTNPARQADA